MGVNVCGEDMKGSYGMRGEEVGCCESIHGTRRGRERGRALTRGVGGAQEVKQDTDDAGDVETQVRRGGGRDADGHDMSACGGRTQTENARAKVGANVCNMDTRKELGVRGEDA